MSHGKEEYLLQVAAMQHIAGAYPMVKAFHVANENKDATSRFFNMKKGVLPGVSDIILGWRDLRSTDNNPIPGAGCIELKIKGGTVSSNQNKFLSAMRSYGWKTGVAYSVKEVHETIRKWGLQPIHNSIKEPDYQTANEKLHAFDDFFRPPSKNQ